MNDDDKLALSYAANIGEIMAIGSLALATGQLWIFAGFVGVFIDVGRKSIDLMKEEKQGKKLTVKDIAGLKALVAQAQRELNGLMKRPEVAHNDALYRKCNSAHQRLSTLRNLLNSRRVKKLREVQLKNISTELVNLENMLKQAKRSKR